MTKKSDSYSVLAVDDNPRVLEALKLVLSERANVMAVTTGETALALLDGKAFDIVITDYHLGEGVNGLQVFRRARERNPFVTACLMTGDEASFKIREVFEAFGGAFISKPFSEE